MNVVKFYSLEVREFWFFKWVFWDFSFIVFFICVFEFCGNVKNELREWIECVDRLFCLGIIYIFGMNIIIGLGVWVLNFVLFVFFKFKIWN